MRPPVARAVVVLAMGAGVFAHQASGPFIPRAWDAPALATLEVPQPNAAFSPQAVPVEYYYRIPVRTIYRGYPVYAPGHEPPGYFEALQRRAPEVLWDDRGTRPRLQTAADWRKAGEAVFDAAIFYEAVVRTADVRDPAWHADVRPPLTTDGVLPFTTYIIREKGKIELGNNACGFCHTRVLPAGAVVKGAQGNFPFDRALAGSLRRRPLRQTRQGLHALFGAPWLERDPAAAMDALGLEEIVARFKSIPAGVAARHRSSLDSPPAIPDLIGVADRVYLDKTGLVVQRGIADLMRYAALNNELDFFSNFGGFIPAGANFRTLPEPTSADVGGRYSDEQLYALAVYLRSLVPPPNPNRRSTLSVQGERAFRRERCGRCHPAPLYTNNRLMAVEGFLPPLEHEGRFDIMSASIDTDPTLTLRTRRGTGYYKVPSLRGLWYRGPLEHNGSVATLDDWFDAARLRNDYIPTGFRGYPERPHAVRGHAFGLALPDADKRALIAFLRTL